MEQSIMARKIQVTTPIRCDYDHRAIEKGKYATQVTGDETVLAQGIYHGSGCYNAALAKYNDELKKIKEGKSEE